MPVDARLRADQPGHGKPRKANHDVTTVRVATTTDGVNFTDVGPASGLFDPTTVQLNGIRYLGSGNILRLANGHYGMFFGAGNCLDNNSDGFHYIGYAETDNPVTDARATSELGHVSTDWTIRSCRPTRSPIPWTAAVSVESADRRRQRRSTR